MRFSCLSVPSRNCGGLEMDAVSVMRRQVEQRVLLTFMPFPTPAFERTISESSEKNRKLLKSTHL